MWPPTIALLDMDPAFLRLMQDFLASEGYDAVPWRGGESAAAMVQRTRPDLVILDLWLDVRESGWTVLHTLWDHPTTRDIPIIVCTSDAMPTGWRAALLHERRCPVLQKPFRLSALLALIDAALDGATGAFPHPVETASAFPLTRDG